MCTITSHKQHAENAVPVAHTSTESTTQIRPHLSPHSSDQFAIPIGSHMVHIYSALSLFTSMLTRHAIGRKTECAILHHSSQRCPRNEVHEDPVPVLLHFHSQRRSMNRLAPIFFTVHLFFDKYYPQISWLTPKPHEMSADKIL